jgi:hypothetical protein
MPFVYKIISLLFSVAGGALVAKILTTLGIGVVTFTGLTALLNNLKAAVFARASGVSADLAGILGLLQIDTCVSIILSAYAIRISLVAVNGTLSKVTFKNSNVPAQ